jgi:hypothetical protein
MSTFGDPAFDLAHMMAHLFLASVHRRSDILLTASGSFHGHYSRTVSSPEKAPLMYRAGPLSAALLLAFVQCDEMHSYLSVEHRTDVTDFAMWWLERSDYTIGQVRSALWTAIDMGFNEKCIDWRKEFSAIPLAHY